ncbi:glutamine--fructose-6-phosphate transaminase (isomerizing) [Methanococcoides seepicolus]|uniref:Glutamine--fructose-6-phosphate aminotransferase [isomerizing] n=1 Tax=Methanococcoides seepicolus TaxID=2828780 RepID=A0A9E4ZFS8_9EURY|nr:glutamine--fructose-6-phosphate transaminase (isomerizing) [Methanococcoides seepicolus]MCM1987108.1 glutamine--fructose-6-phosphate transaminase (isomerizing) [Methanococcoides seepicolus]
MCGIIGYVGTRDAAPILVESLKKLEYRGYDSAGITLLNENITTYKTIGRIKDLEKILKDNIKGNIGIGHTRWATHGVPSTVNSHPHNSGDISVVHNGIIENYLNIKEQLQKEGYKFLSETDTEVIAHLMHSKLYGSAKNTEKTCDLFTALQQTLKELEGSYAITTVCSSEPDTMLAARKDSPLIIGIGDGEYYAASDVTAFLSHTKKVVFVDDLNLVKMQPIGVEFYDIDGKLIEKETTTIEWDIEAAEKAGYDHFMLKEIHEQATSVHDTFAGKLSELDGSVNLEELNISDEEIRNIDRIEIIACGTSWNAGLLGKYFFENFAGIHTDVDIASEFRYGNPIMRKNVISIAITQSGETADTLAAVKSCKAYGCSSIAITNVVGSSITRVVDSVLYTRAGPEIGVAATKTFTAQLIVLYLLSIRFARARGTINTNEAKDLLIELKRIPGKIQKILNRKAEIRECAEIFAEERDYFFVGRNVNYPVALEGALKLKEISYIHAEGFAGGELKHGPLALLDEGTPVVAIATKGHVYDKILSNIKEVKAREARVIAVAEKGDTEIEKYVDHVLRIPPTHEMLAPILSSVVLQLLAYYTALARDCSIDKPKNLAKSVTVE